MDTEARFDCLAGYVVNHRGGDFDESGIPLKRREMKTSEK